MLRQVKASAGSGKTYELTRSYMEKLAAVRGDPKSMAQAAAGILAVTFTNAAANEMRARVIRQLKLAALNAENGSIDSARASLWLDILLRDFSALNIRTIDSLLHQIVRASALDLDISPEYEIIFDTQKALQPAIEYFLDAASEEGEVRDLLHEACRRIVLDPKLSGFYGNRIFSSVNMVLESCMQGKFADLASREEMESKIASLAQALRKSAAALTDTANHAGISLNGNKMGCLRKILNGVIPSGLPVAASITDPEEVLNKSSKGKGTLISGQLADFRDACSEYYLRLPELNRGIGYLPFIALAEQLVRIFRAMHKEQGILPQAIISYLAGGALATEQGVSDALCRLGSRLDHFLVDEFQDTSPDQWRALRPLVKEAAARGGSFTWVGDAKQSIYSFRGGDPWLFDDILRDKELLAVAPAPQTDILERNWRSLPAIVDFNNKFFAPLADPEQAKTIFAAMLGRPEDSPQVLDIASRAAHVYADIRQKPALNKGDFTGYVNLSAGNSADAGDPWQEIVASVTERAIERHEQGRSWSEMMILVDSNDHAREIAESMVSCDVPVMTENSLLLAQNPLIVACLSFLRFMNDPSDEVALFALLQSELTGELLREAGFSLAAFIEDARESKSLADHLREGWPACWEALFPPASAAPSAPYDLVARWLIHIRAFERFPESNAILRSFLESIHQAECEDLSSIGAILDYWQTDSSEERLPAPGQMNAVRIMTIHKAKGLEAPVVLVAGTAYRVKPSDAVFIDDIGGLKVAATYRSDMGSLHDAELARKSLEAFNMLYVAMTRAGEELHVFLSEYACNSPMYKGLSELLRLNGFTACYASGMAPELECGEEEDAQSVCCCLEARMPRLNIYRNHVASGGLTAAERGTIMHASLERMELTGQPEAEASAGLAAALRRCRVSVPENAKAGLLEGLTWFAGLKQARTWMKRGLREQPLLNDRGEILRPDLIVPGADGPLVIDYKSGDPQDDHCRQVQEYMKCLERSGHFDGIPRGLLVYLDHKAFRQVGSQSCSVLQHSI